MEHTRDERVPLPRSEEGGARERLAQVGPAALSDEELVALLLGTGSHGQSVRLLATRLIEATGGIAGLERMGAGRLAQLAGVGPGKACRLVAAVELGRRVLSRPLVRGARLACSRDVDAAMRPRLDREPVEHLLAIPLDARNRTMGELPIARGGSSHCPVRPGDVFRALLQEGATSVVLVHNHPSGEPSPSPEDVAMTERLREAGEVLGIAVVDHVIVGREGYFSFLDAGLLGPKEHDA
jgi:DNA repair protein RadC